MCQQYYVRNTYDQYIHTVGIFIFLSFSILRKSSGTSIFKSSTQSQQRVRSRTSCDSYVYLRKGCESYEVVLVTTCDRFLRQGRSATQGFILFLEIEMVFIFSRYCKIKLKIKLQYLSQSLRIQIKLAWYSLFQGFGSNPCIRWWSIGGAPPMFRW